MRLSNLIEEIVEDREERSMCIPCFTWTDVDSGDSFEAGATKDGEWMVVTRVSKVRGEVVRFDVPREAFAYIVKQLGGSL